MSATSSTSRATAAPTVSQAERAAEEPKVRRATRRVAPAGRTPNGVGTTTRRTSATAIDPGFAPRFSRKCEDPRPGEGGHMLDLRWEQGGGDGDDDDGGGSSRSEEHTSELQSHSDL